LSYNCEDKDKFDAVFINSER